MNYVLGIDGGGTKTTCFLMNDRKEVLSQGEAGPSNYQRMGLEQTGRAIQASISHCLLKISPLPHQVITGICLGLAGVGRTDEIKLLTQWAQKNLPIHLTSLQWSSPSHPLIYVCSDSLIALVAGIGHPVGIVTIAGTGSQIFGRNQNGQVKRVGGWGYLLGDEGSGYDLAIKALQAVLQSFDGRLPPTQLTSVILNHLGLQHPQELIPLIYRQEWGVTDIASLAPLVAEVAMSGDPIAQRILKESIWELVWATRIAIKFLFHPEEMVEIVTLGGIWKIAKIRQGFKQTIETVFPYAQVILPRYEPAYGAGLLALETPS